MSTTHSLERVSSEKKAQEELDVSLSNPTQDVEHLQTPVVYKLYKRRWFGIITLVSSR